MAAPAPPATYAECYAARGDDLGGTYTQLWAEWLDFTGVDDDALFDRVVQSSGVTGIPKVYAVLVNAPQPTIAFLHRPTLYRGHPVTPSRYDGHAFAFLGEKDDHYHVDMIEFPVNAFETVQARVRDAAATAAAVEAHADQENGLLDGPGPTTGQLVRVCRAVPIPFSLVAAVLDTAMSPIQFWTRVIRPLMRDQNTFRNYAPLCLWASVAVTGVHVPDTGAGPQADGPPAVSAGDVDTFLPPPPLRQLLQSVQSVQLLQSMQSVQSVQKYTKTC